jgi:hypothetical protein
MEEIENKLRLAYISVRRKTDSYFKGSSDLEKVLPFVAAFCAEYQLDPDIYIKAVDKYKITPKLYPNQLKSKSALDIYNKYLSEFQSDDVLSLEIQKKYLLEAIKNGRTVRSVLLDDSIDFEPWFRILITKDIISDIYCKYIDQAKEQASPNLISFLTRLGMDVGRITNANIR